MLYVPTTLQVNVNYPHSIGCETGLQGVKFIQGYKVSTFDLKPVSFVSHHAACCSTFYISEHALLAILLLLTYHHSH